LFGELFQNVLIVTTGNLCVIACDNAHFTSPSA
jgi:hypothetical protein